MTSMRRIFRLHFDDGSKPCDPIYGFCPRCGKWHWGKSC